MALVLCHTVSSFILWTTLVGLAAWPAIARALREAPTTSVETTRQVGINLLILTLAMVTHWGESTSTPAGESFLARMLLNLQDSVSTDAGFLNRTVTDTGLLQEELAGTAGFGLFYFLLVLGALVWLRRRQMADDRRALIAAVALLSAISLSCFPSSACATSCHTAGSRSHGYWARLLLLLDWSRSARHGDAASWIT